MNNSSPIEISKSSLLSLKAEVLRKQQEVSKAKLLQTKQREVQTPLRQKAKNNSVQDQNEPQNKGIEDRQARDEIEDENMLQKSRKMLEAKSRLYNRLVKGPSDLTESELERNKHYLVQFDRKPREKPEESSEEEYFSDEYEPPTNPDDEWVEYTDCLGRTRKCLRKDLEYLKQKDLELSRSLGPDGKRITNESPKSGSDTKDGKNVEKEENFQMDPTQNLTENNELLSSDMRRELMRQEWEKQEQELMNKKNVHYQDLLFNEARSHGVGYYAFSKDEEERGKQQEELRKLREETTQKQQNSVEQKALREKQLAARLKAARNRKRARMGLPAEEDEPEDPISAPQVQEDKEPQKPTEEKVEEEREKEEARKHHIRPWDIGKEELVKKQHYEYTQEEWVEKKRSERPKEFAPPTLFKPDYKKEQKNTNLPEPEDKSLFFTTKKSKNPPTQNFHRKNEQKISEFSVDTTVPPPNFNSSTSEKKSSCYDKKFLDAEKSGRNNSGFDPTPIRNELSESESEDEEEIAKRNKNKRKGTEFAPPATFDYYGPSASKSKKADFGSTSLEESISAGLKYLRQQAEKKEKMAARRNINDD